MKISKFPDTVLSNRDDSNLTHLNERKTPNLRGALASWTGVFKKGEHVIPFFLIKPNIFKHRRVDSYISSPMIYRFIYFPLIHRALYCFPQNTPRRSTVTLKGSMESNFLSMDLLPNVATILVHHSSVNWPNIFPWRHLDGCDRLTRVHRAFCNTEQRITEWTRIVFLRRVHTITYSRMTIGRKSHGNVPPVSQI